MRMFICTCVHYLNNVDNQEIYIYYKKGSILLHGFSPDSLPIPHKLTRIPHTSGDCKTAFQR